jgi:hypothetical protein
MARFSHKGGHMTRYLKSTLAVLSVLAATTGPVLADDDFFGGTGGSPFPSAICPPGKVVIGLVGTAGAVLNTIKVLCGKANGDDHDPPISPIITSVDTNPDPKDPNSAAFRGGGPTSAVCPPLTAARQIQVSMKMWRGHFAVSQIKLSCFYLDGSLVIPPKVFGNDDGINTIPANSPQHPHTDTTSCGDHMLMNGLQGRHGTWIDAVGLSCVPTSSLQGG